MDKRELANRIVGSICTDLVILPLPARWKKLVDKVEEELIAAEQSVHPTAATCSACGRELLPDGSCPNDDPSTRNSG